MSNGQNTSTAVMQRRVEARDSLDDFPTPPWGTRALMEHVVIDTYGYKQTCLEPAANRGFMVRPLSEYFDRVDGSDVQDYGAGYPVKDFLRDNPEPVTYDWVITNPPFKLAEAFIHRALSMVRYGVAVLVRTSFLESVGRWERLYKDNPPHTVAQFTERLPIVKARCHPSATTATSYAWLVWYPNSHYASTRMRWIPPCRKSLERADDYDWQEPENE